MRPPNGQQAPSPDDTGNQNTIQQQIDKIAQLIREIAGGIYSEPNHYFTECGFYYRIDRFLNTLLGATQEDGGYATTEIQELREALSENEILIVLESILAFFQQFEKEKRLRYAGVIFAPQIDPNETKLEDCEVNDNGQIQICSANNPNQPRYVQLPPNLNGSTKLIEIYTFLHAVRDQTLWESSGRDFLDGKAQANLLEVWGPMNSGKSGLVQEFLTRAAIELIWEKQAKFKGLIDRISTKYHAAVSSPIDLMNAIEYLYSNRKGNEELIGEFEKSISMVMKAHCFISPGMKRNFVGGRAKNLPKYNAIPTTFNEQFDSEVHQDPYYSLVSELDFLASKDPGLDEKLNVVVIEEASFIAFSEEELQQLDELISKLTQTGYKVIILGLNKDFQAVDLPMAAASREQGLQYQRQQLFLSSFYAHQTLTGDVRIMEAEATARWYAHQASFLGHLFDVFCDIYAPQVPFKNSLQYSAIPLALHFVEVVGRANPELAEKLREIQNEDFKNQLKGITDNQATNREA